MCNCFSLLGDVWIYISIVVHSFSYWWGSPVVTFHFHFPISRLLLLSHWAFLVLFICRLVGGGATSIRLANRGSRRQARFHAKPIETEDAFLDIQLGIARSWDIQMGGTHALTVDSCRRNRIAKDSTSEPAYCHQRQIKVRWAPAHVTLQFISSMQRK